MSQLATLLRAPFEVTNANGERAVTMEEGRVATDGHVTVRVMDDIESRRMFRRRANKRGAETGGVMSAEWLVVQVDGVNIYIGHDQVIVSKKELWP